jgi:hypothetical protein
MFMNDVRNSWQLGMIYLIRTIIEITKKKQQKTNT